MENIKVKVNLPNKVYDCLIHDAESFGFVKNDSTINKNKFINILISKYFPKFSDLETRVINAVNGQLKFKEEDYPLISGIYFEAKFKKEGNYDKDLQFIISKENEKIMDEILFVHLRNRSISQYFREMFIHYAANIQQDREKIIFFDIVNKINKVISDQKKCFLITNGNNKKVFDLYKLVPTKEEFFNYLIGIENENGGRKVKSIHLKDIINVVECPKEDICFNKDEIEKMDLTIFQDPAFEINEIYDCEVELSDVGVRLYNLWVHDRPTPYKVVGNKYYFKAGLTHIVIYFFKFSKEALILKPKEVRNFIQERYAQAVESYKNH